MNATGGAPALSIGLPVYNGEPFLAETVESLLAQTFTDFELIIADNASTDATRSYCERTAAADSRVRYSRHERNMGAAWNYNHTVELARGRLFMWTGHDDLRLPDHLERCVAEFDSPEPPVLVYPRTTLIDEAGSIIRPYDDGLDLPWDRPSARIRGLLQNLDLANAVFGVIQTDVLRATGLIRRFVYSDLVLLYELALAGQFVEIPDPLFQRRMHAKMSHRANTTASTRLAWFTGAAGGRRVVFPRTRLFFEMARVTVRAPIEPLERLRCLLWLLRIWGPRYSKLIAREVALAPLIASRSLRRPGASGN